MARWRAVLTESYPLLWMPARGFPAWVIDLWMRNRLQETDYTALVYGRLCVCFKYQFRSLDGRSKECTDVVISSRYKYYDRLQRGKKEMFKLTIYDANRVDLRIWAEAQNDTTVEPSRCMRLMRLIWLWIDDEVVVHRGKGLAHPGMARPCKRSRRRKHGASARTTWRSDAVDISSIKCRRWRDCSRLRFAVHSRSRLSAGTYPVQQTHLGHWPSISRIESMREAHECVVVSKHQLVGSQRNERLVLGRRQD